MDSLEEIIVEIGRLGDREYMNDKCIEVSEKLAEIGKIEASKRFYAAPYDDGNDVNDVLVYTEGKGAEFSVVAEGEAVTFIEFGAGIHYNGTEPYPEPRPDGIVNIGDYGYKQGRKDKWYYTTPDGVKHETHGTPATMPMYHAGKAIVKAAEEVVAEVFKDI